MDKEKFLTTRQAAKLTGASSVTWWRACLNNHGFAFRINKKFYIPRDHVERVRLGETPAQIAAEVRKKSGFFEESEQP